MLRRVRLTTLSILLLVLATLAAAGAAPQRDGRPLPDSTSFCLRPPPPPGVTDLSAPARDIYCLDLIPRPDMREATGVVELARAASPFDVAVTADGHPRSDLVMHLSGLPDPASLGPYTVYVAWIAPPVLDPVRKLGVVGNGTSRLGTTALDKYLIMVSAEAADTVSERRGRLVLRGNSPSTRLQRHDLLMLPQGGGHVMDAAWPMPPMDSSIPMFMPGIDALSPRETPLLPTPASAGVPPRARPRQVVDLRDGDTLRLSAGFVRRSIGGRELTMYGFNGQYPGPLLRVRRDATVTIEFTNLIDEPSAIHWHGIRLDNRYDGAPGVTQDPVPPGGRFTYRVHFPDAGLYWYHSHVREDVQQDLGLYGNLFVPWGGEGETVNREEFLILDDLLLTGDGLFPFGTATPIHALMGRFGNVLLVNGEPRYALSVRPGEVVRFYLTNVSNTRTFNLAFGGARMKVVAADAGRFEHEAWVESVPIAPAQRYVIDAQFPAGGPYPVLNRVQALNHSYGYFFAESDTLGTVRVAGPAAAPDYGSRFGQARADTALGRDLGAFRRFLDAPPDHTLELTLETRDLPLALEQILQLETSYFPPVEWSGTMPMMDWLTTGAQAHWTLRDPATGRENMAINWRFRVGDLVKIRLVNDRWTLHGMQHPIHLHGQRFLVLAQNGVANDNLAWKDTVLVPVGSTADILVEMSNPGRWMMHCHIAEHLQSGMMAVFEVN